MGGAGCLNTTLYAENAAQASPILCADSLAREDLPISSRRQLVCSRPYGAVSRGAVPDKGALAWPKFLKMIGHRLSDHIGCCVLVWPVFPHLPSISGERDVCPALKQGIQTIVRYPGENLAFR